MQKVVNLSNDSVAKAAVAGGKDGLLVDAATLRMPPGVESGSGDWELVGRS